jgi:hypothetical protein
MRIRLAPALLLVASFVILPPPAHATVTHTATGVSAKGVPVEFEAALTISGDILTVTLTNNSPVHSLNPDDVLGSYYFDILDGGNNRPALTYLSATGDVYLADMDAPDVLQAAGADVMAVAAGDDSWQFRNMDAAFSPFLGFGLGTVGNNNLSPNNFMGNIVDGIDFSISKGDITTQNLDGKRLVRDMATFTFSGLTGYTEADISSEFSFGLGTAPDSLLVPEPATLSFLALAGLALRRRP